MAHTRRKRWTDVEAMLHIVPADSKCPSQQGHDITRNGPTHRGAQPHLNGSRTATYVTGRWCHSPQPAWKSGDAEAAAALLRNDFSLEQRTWNDIRKAELLCEAERSLGAPDSVGFVLERALAREPNDPRVLALAAKHGEVWGDPADPASFLVRALGLAGDDDHVEVASRLANLYVRQERFSDAADQYLKVVCVRTRLNTAVMALLGSLGNSGRAARSAGVVTKDSRAASPPAPLRHRVRGANSGTGRRRIGSHRTVGGALLPRRLDDVLTMHTSPTRCSGAVTSLEHGTRCGRSTPRNLSASRKHC